MNNLQIADVRPQKLHCQVLVGETEHLRRRDLVEELLHSVEWVQEHLRIVQLAVVAHQLGMQIQVAPRLGQVLDPKHPLGEEVQHLALGLLHGVNQDLAHQPGTWGIGHQLGVVLEMEAEHRRHQGKIQLEHLVLVHGTILRKFPLLVCGLHRLLGYLFPFSVVLMF